MASPTTELEIDNMALGRMGAKIITQAQLDANTDPKAIQCNLNYDQTRDALLRSHWWRFAAERADLAVIANGDFSRWTSDDPDDWTVTGEIAGTDEVSQVGATEGYGGTGTKKCNIYSTTDGTGIFITQTITTVIGKEYKFSINIDTITAGKVGVLGLPTGAVSYDSTGVKAVTFTADATSFILTIAGGTAIATDVTFDSISIYLVPVFEWSFGYRLPTDFLAMRSIWGENNPRDNTIYSYALEGNYLYSNENSMKIRYTKRVTDVAKFDPLFIEVFVLSLNLKLVLPLSQDLKMYESVKDELFGSPRRPGLMSKVRAMDKQEQNTTGIYDYNTWVSAFRSSRDPLHLGGP